MMPLLPLLLLLGSLGAWAATTPSNRPTRGYQARDSGMDFEHDGTFNTNLCDGSDTSADEDVDGAGAARDDQCYVECGGGSSDDDCGSPAKPCSTVAKCMTDGNTAANARWRIGSPSSTQIQAICIKGTCTSVVTVSQSGASGTVSISPTGSEQNTFQYPRYPLVIMGWDADGDGAYPPKDGDDTAVIDGGTGAAGWAFTNGGNYSRWEVAHLTLRDFGSPSNSGGALDPVGEVYGDTISHIYAHDMQWTSLCDYTAANGTSPSGNSNCIAVPFDMFAGTNVDYLAFENINAQYIGAFWQRLSVADTAGTSSDYCRWKNITYSGRPYDTGTEKSLGLWKMWGSTAYLEILDSDFDAGCGTNWDCTVATIIMSGYDGQCNAQNTTIRNTTWTNWKVPLQINADYSGYCTITPRDVTGMVFDANELVNTVNWAQNSYPILVVGSTSRLDGFTFTNNILLDTVGDTTGGILIDGPSTTTDGVKVIAGNTIHGGTFSDSSYGGAITLRSGSGNHWRIYDNIVAGISGGRNIKVDYAPTDFLADGNVYDADGSYIWNAGTARTTLSGWQGDTSEDDNSTECAPTFASATDLHLATGSCAISAGQTFASLTTDYDGQTRASVYDAGADEYVAETTPSGSGRPALETRPRRQSPRVNTPRQQGPRRIRWMPRYDRVRRRCAA